MKIPKIIHRMWYDKQILDNEGPPNLHNNLYLEYEESWKQHHPNFQFIFWNSQKLQELFEEEELKEFKKFWESLPHHIEKCDYARYALLYKYGGTYVDLDFKCLKSFTPLLKGKELLLFREPKEHIHRNEPISGNSANWIKRNGSISNSLISCAPRHPFMLYLLKYIRKNFQERQNIGDAVFTTGPRVINIALIDFCKKKKLKRSSFLGDTCDILPFNFNRKISQGCESRVISGKEPDSYTYTLWNQGTGWPKEYVGEKISYNYILTYFSYWIILLAIFALLIVLLLG